MRAFAPWRVRRVVSCWWTGRHTAASCPQESCSPSLLFYRGEYTGIEPDKNTPAQWRDDLEAFLTATTPDTWL